MIIRNILKNKVEKNIINVVGNIVMLPAIPIFWLIINTPEPSSNIFISLYFPLIITFLVLLTTFINLIKFVKNKS